MTVIIGGGSSLNAPNLLASAIGVLSVNFEISPNVERLWQLGSFSPYDTVVTRQRTLSMVVYGRRPDGKGGSLVQSIPASTSCADVSSNRIEFNAVACQSGQAVSFVDYFYATSYSYSKEAQGFGQESWAFTTKPYVVGYTGSIFMLRGISTGKLLVSSADVMTESEVGMVVDTAASQDSNGAYIDGESGSVSAGFPGIGSFDISREVVVSSVGGSIGKKDGYRGNASCSIPVQPVFL